ncbi:MAG: OmpA family protein [Bacteroidales bacterium]|nr:OmpA family protein [Bacteroidales bacterium]
MKKFFAIAAAVLIAVASFAQETNRDENGNLKFGGYETNGFWDNWTIGLGWNAIPTTTTTPLYIPTVYGQIGNFTKAFPGGIELFALKWIEPCYGVRFGWTGMQTVDPVADVVKNLNYAHVDIVWNICNAWWGYKEGRKFELSPYLSLAPFMRGGKALTAGAGAGLYGTLNLSEKWGIFGDLGGILADSKLLTTAGDTYNYWKLEVGVVYNAGKTNWTRTATTAAAAAAAIAAAKAAQDAAESKVAGAQKAADDAKKEADNAKDEAKQLVDEAKKAASTNVDGLFDEPVVVYFEIGQSKLSKKEKAHAEYAIKNIISRGENVKFTLNGSADTGTGSKARNKQLSEQRAKTVYNLVDELGVSRENITVVEWDGTERFATPELNRAVIIEKQ